MVHSFKCGKGNGGELANEKLQEMSENPNSISHTATKNPWHNVDCWKVIVYHAIYVVLEEDKSETPLSVTLSWAIDARSSL